MCYLLKTVPMQFEDALYVTDSFHAALGCSVAAKSMWFGDALFVTDGSHAAWGCSVCSLFPCSLSLSVTHCIHAAWGCSV